MVLASSPVCRVQAMRVGERAWSMQYHVEVEDDTVRNWGEIPAYRQALESVLGEDSVDALAADADRHMDGFVSDAEQLYRNFMSRRRLATGHPEPRAAFSSQTVVASSVCLDLVLCYPLAHRCLRSSCWLPNSEQGREQRWRR